MHALKEGFLYIVFEGIRRSAGYHEATTKEESGPLGGVSAPAIKKLSLDGSLQADHRVRESYQ